MRYGAVCVCGVWCVGGAMWLDGIPRVSPQHASHPAARRGLRRLRHTKTDSKQEGGDRDSISRGGGEPSGGSSRTACSGGGKPPSPIAGCPSPLLPPPAHAKVEE